MLLPKTRAFKAPETSELPNYDQIYRVEFVGDIARVGCLGIPISPHKVFGHGAEMPIADLPDWIARRVAVLHTMTYEPPTEYIDKIGRRISKNVYWIFYEGE